MSSRQEEQPRKKRTAQRWLRFSLRSLFVLVTLSCVALYVYNELTWYQKKRVAEVWTSQLLQVVEQETARRAAHPDKHWYVRAAPLPSCPGALTKSEQLEILHIGISALPETRQRVASVKLLAEVFPGDAAEMLRRVVQENSHAEVRALCLRLLALRREKQDAELALPLLSDGDADVRAAAADCLGIVHFPAYGIPMAGIDATTLACDPPIWVQPLIDERFYGGGHPGWRTMREHLPGDVIDLPEATRLALEQMMLAGPTVTERVAAARALVTWPPKTYKLRFAEWGVWIDDGGDLKLFQAVIEETPTFVHRTFNSIESFSDRLYSIAISKPVLHITTDRPLAIDIDVQISQGRPWLAYPRPDNFSLSVWRRYWTDEDAPLLGEFNRDGGPILQPLAEGFPWLWPAHRTYANAQIVGVGLRWQSLIVSPYKLPWMAAPDIGKDPRFAWWGRLRDVPSSWVSSQGETERFLYYDGPTLARSPIRVAFDGRSLWYCTQDMFGSGDENSEESAQQRKPRTGVFIRVDGAALKGYRAAVNELSGKFVPEDAQAIEGNAVHDTFLKMLTDRGLTREEAQGLYESWKAQFFQTPGNRLLTFLSAADYDAMCPLTIRPQPTETVRVGIVLSEL